MTSTGDAVPSDPAPGDPAPGDPVPGDRVPGDPVLGGPVPGEHRVCDAGDDGAVDAAVAALSAGGVIVLPTDTVYGLAADASQPAATAMLFDRKGRGADVPVAVLCASAADAFSLVDAVVPAARRLADEHWPGPLTLVLPRRSDLDWALGDPADTIGLRVPDSSFVHAVAARVGPLATTSANRHGVPTPPEAMAAADSLTGPVDLVVDGGTCGSAASTVVAVDRDGALRILRQGDAPVA